MKHTVKKICLSVLRDLAVLAIIILFIIALGVATNIAMEITINEYMMLLKV